MSHKVIYLEEDIRNIKDKNNDLNEPCKDMSESKSSTRVSKKKKKKLPLLTTNKKNARKCLVQMNILYQKMKLNKWCSVVLNVIMLLKKKHL